MCSPTAFLLLLLPAPLLQSAKLYALDFDFQMNQKTLASVKLQIRHVSTAQHHHHHHHHHQQQQQQQQQQRLLQCFST
jgi:hypothetical protein